MSLQSTWPLSPFSSLLLLAPEARILNLSIYESIRDDRSAIEIERRMLHKSESANLNSASLPQIRYGLYKTTQYESQYIVAFLRKCKYIQIYVGTVWLCALFF